MKSLRRGLPPHALISLRTALAILAITPLVAQVAPEPHFDPGTLARYDRNKNGRLDPDERLVMESDQKKVVPIGATAGPVETVVLSPFEVVADNKGYFAANTMSGTRLNSKLEDLGSAISVITKEQMADFAMLDINDIFLYGTNTEGTGTFTDMTAEDAQGVISDNVAGNPGNANRIRGIGNANVSNGNFETSNRVPIDPLDADGVEISRGPNANIFGLGNPSGTVNIVGSAANPRKDRTQVSLRVDSYDGYRSSIDLNRVLAKDRLAVRVSAAKQRDGFDLKPSGVDSIRYNGMIQFRPFRRTTLNASYQYYRAEGNRPNSLPPLDGISDWRRAGSPTWDPLTNAMKLNGVPVNGAPDYLYTQSNNFGQLFVEREGGIKIWSASYGVAGATPAATPQANRRLVTTRALVNDAQPLIGRRVPMVTDKSIYDWSSINLNSPNRFSDKTETSRVTLDQVFFDSSLHSLAAQVGWFKEDSERDTLYIMADGATHGGPTGQLVVDPNERLLDGRPNPFFMRPLIAQTDPRTNRTPLRNDTYRSQFAYKIDFTSQRGFLRWLGAHSLVGYAEYKDKVQRSYKFYEAFSSNNPWLFTSPTANRLITNLTRPNLRFYVGDTQGQNVDYAPGSYSHGPYTYTWGNAVTGAINQEAVELGEVPNGTASGTHSIQKTSGAILQSRLLKDRIVTTFGEREDRLYSKFQNPTRLTDRGLTYDYAYMNHWREGDWQVGDGRTYQRGVVVKPFRGLGFIDRSSEQGNSAERLVASTLRGLSLHYNRSDSFLPASPAQNVFAQWLPDPSGKGKDYGFALNLLEGKLVLRVNKYETKQINSRNGPSAGFARILLGADFNNTSFGLQQEATAWITDAATAKGVTLTPAELNAELTRVMGVPPRDAGEVNALVTSETDDIVGRGHEMEIHYNPTNYWTVQIGFTEKQTINSQIAPNISAYLAQRLPYWTTIVDPRNGRLWWNTLYQNVETASESITRTVLNPLKLAQATVGLTRPQLRRYGGSLSTNFRLSGITQQSIFKRINLGGALRYESRGAIGYYGVQQLPNIITDYNISRPIWDEAHVYGDAFAGFRTRLWNDKIGATFQLNVRNVQEGGRLQPIAAFPDGRPYSYRIVSPRQFILSANFDL